MYLLVPDKSSKTCVTQGRAESLEFIAGTFGDKFDPAIREVANGAGEVKAGGDSFGGIAEAHPLDLTGVMNSQAAAQSMIVGRRHTRDKAKGGCAMQLFSEAATQFFFILV
jgi:hypothetical protein